MEVARERDADVVGRAREPVRRGLPLVVGVCVLLVELTWLAALAYLLWLVVSLF